MKPQSCQICATHEFEFIVKSESQLLVHASVLNGQKFDFWRCRTCGFVSLGSGLKEEELAAAYDESYLPHAAERLWGKFAQLVGQSLQRNAERRASWTVRMAKTQSMRLLDYGFGSPVFLRAFAENHLNRFALGLDPFTAHKDSHERLENGNTVELKRGRIEGLGALEEEGKFDIVTLWHVIEHFRDPIAILSKIREVASTRGILVVETPNFDHWARRWLQGDWPGFHTPRHFHLFTKKTLQQALGKAGWANVKFYHGGFLSDFTLIWLKRLDKVLRRPNFVSLEKELFLFVICSALLSPIFWILGAFFGRGTLLAVARNIPTEN